MSPVRAAQDIPYNLDYQAGLDQAHQYIGYLGGDVKQIVGEPVFTGDTN